MRTAARDPGAARARARRGADGARLALVAAVPLAALLALPRPGDAQLRELVVEVGASEARPPADLVADPGRFLVGGVRARAARADGSTLFASFLGGRTLDDATGGDFLSGRAGGALWRSLRPGLAVGFEVEGIGFQVDSPFLYRTFAAEGGPVLRYTDGGLVARLAGVGGVGRSRVELRQGDGERTRVRVAEDDLWRVGAEGELLVAAGPVLLGGGAGVHRSAAGTYGSAGERVLLAGNGPVVELRLDAWSTPLGSETTGGVALVLPVGGAWSLRGFLGRTEPDPLTLSEPGGGAGGLLLGLRVAGSETPARPAPLHEVVRTGEDGASVRIRVRVPAGAARVEVLGDFSLWEPVAMRRSGGSWVAEVTMPWGTHHFGFLVDGSWYVPTDAPDTVPDEWGRRNATLVIERSDPTPTGDGKEGDR